MDVGVINDIGESECEIDDDGGEDDVYDDDVKERFCDNEGSDEDVNDDSGDRENNFKD